MDQKADLQEKTVPAGDRLSHPLSLEDLTFRQLFEKFGPLIDSENATPLLGFNTRAALQKAISQGRLPLQLIRPQGRKKTFLATRALAKYMAQMAEEVAM